MKKQQRGGRALLEYLASTNVRGMRRDVKRRRFWARLFRLPCLVGWHRYAFHHREPLSGRYWMCYDRCARCGQMTARGEWL